MIVKMDNDAFIHFTLTPELCVKIAKFGARTRSDAILDIHWISQSIARESRIKRINYNHWEKFQVVEKIAEMIVART